VPAVRQAWGHVATVSRHAQAGSRQPGADVAKRDAEPAHPTVNVPFQANLASGDGAALHTWWLKNVTVVEPGT
jgi:hypothetical protein